MPPPPLPPSLSSLGCPCCGCAGAWVVVEGGGEAPSPEVNRWKSECRKAGVMDVEPTTLDTPH